MHETAFCFARGYLNRADLRFKPAGPRGTAQCRLLTMAPSIAAQGRSESGSSGLVLHEREAGAGKVMPDLPRRGIDSGGA